MTPPETDPGAPGHLLVLGYGYTAERLGGRLLAEGWTVSGTTRSDEGLRRLESLGVRPVRFTGTAPSDELRGVLGEATHLLNSIPPERDPSTPAESTDPALRHHAEDIVGRGDAGDDRPLRWLGLLSTTGVYGGQGGGWVDEETPPDPGVDRSRRRVAVEIRWTEIARRAGLPLQIFRLPGIYGPGRSALDRVSDPDARRIVKEGTVSNRIHVDDIAGCVRVAMTRPELTGPINVTDDLPAPGHEVLAHAAGLLGIPAPPAVPFEEADLSPMARSFYTEDRRVRNRRMKERFGYRLQHPTYREGLAAILRETTHPGDPRTD